MVGLAGDFGSDNPKAEGIPEGTVLAENRIQSMYVVFDDDRSHQVGVPVFGQSSVDEAWAAKGNNPAERRIGVAVLVAPLVIGGTQECIGGT